MNQVLQAPPKCEKCGELKRPVKAKETPSGYRWRCRACQGKFLKNWKEEVDYNRTERERYAASEEKRSLASDRSRAWRNTETGRNWLEEYAQQPERKACQQRVTMNANLKRNYGITVEDYEKMLCKQEGRCAICDRQGLYGKRSERLCVDHCHETGKIRQLLCKPCNTALGGFSDNVDNLEAAVLYLKKHAELGTAS